MSLLLKDPEAVLDYSVDWGTSYLGEDAIADSRWSIAPAEPGGVQIAASAFDAGLASVHVGGGEIGKLYRLTNHVCTAGGREDSRSIMLRVEKR